MPTPDKITGVTVPASGLIEIYAALELSSSAGTPGSGATVELDIGGFGTSLAGGGGLCGFANTLFFTPVQLVSGLGSTNFFTSVGTGASPSVPRLRGGYMIVETTPGTNVTVELRYFNTTGTGATAARRVLAVRSAFA